ncbi:MATE family efflux transporter [Bacillus cereus]|uniref:tryglysin-associated MATE efflux transporter WgkD n=1 Tax=Bacillus nitratireducens TaxID=2026193 RepID=UPI00027AA457|nr:MATE family efflux transporter [Bacillus nitratireducens]EJS46652.1 MATE efflux family protein [Bacillus cereus BAG1X1-3]EOO75348.1 MATE efflux family protein [Bacillus cereus BAG1O-1]PDY22463.1 MATE family efflux transporter [Bacillus cereus]MDR4173741.1 MATE family efflux transporter [Bacillus nitratireducens]MED0906772.1 MATE family efflux transporter [Bacillus nitratireducens]
MRFNYLNSIKEINHIAVPLVVNSIAGLLIKLVDQAMIGRISVEAYGAIGVVSSLLFTFAGILGVMSVSFNIYGSRSMGQEDIKSFNNYFISSIFLNIIIGISLALLLLIFQRPLLSIVFGFEGNILEDSIQYLTIMSVYILIQLLLFTFSTFFKIIKETKWIFIGSTVASILNVILNYLLIFGNFGFPKLGISGSAIATIIALSINLIFYMYLCRKQLKITFLNFKIYINNLKFLCKKSTSLVGQEILEGGIFIIGVNAMIARTGDIQLSGYLLVSQILSIILIPMYMYSSAILTLVSERYGSKQLMDLKELPRVTLGLIMVFYMFLSIIFVFLKYEVVAFITNDTNLINYAASILTFIIIANIFNPLHNVYKYALQAIGQSNYVLIKTAIINLITFVMMVITIYVFNLNIFGVFISLFFNYVMLSIIFSRKYKGILNGIESNKKKILA